MAETYLYFGPPGSGKSTEIVNQANRAVDAYAHRTGCAPEDCRDVLVTSLTRAAKGEIRKRQNMRMSAECVSTLHSLAYKAIGRPRMLEDKKHLDDWNAEAARKDGRWLIGSFNSNGSSQENRPGDLLYAEMTKLRARLIPQEKWDPSITGFGAYFDSWKRTNGLYDFQDCVEFAEKTTDTAPGNPKVIFCDEAQDHDASQFKLLRKWAEKAEKLVVVGDPLQAIFTWRGSDPDAFYELPCVWKRTLPHPAGPTWRIPASVHGVAISIAERIDAIEEGRNRMAMDYRPRAAQEGYTLEGFVRRRACCFGDPYDARSIVEDAKAQIGSGRTVMFLATCAYQLRFIKEELQNAGIAYHNPYSSTNASFSPIEYSPPGGTGYRLRSFLTPSPAVFGENARLWTYQELHAWTEMVSAKDLLQVGAKTRMREKANDAKTKYQSASQEDLKAWFWPEAIEQLDKAVEAGDLRWLLDRLTKGSITPAPLAYVTNLLNRSGPRGIVDEPRVILSTIHGAKGGESDVVYISNELSSAGASDYAFDPLNMLRAFYVGATRAKEGLVMCYDPGAKTFRF